MQYFDKDEFARAIIPHLPRTCQNCFAPAEHCLVDSGEGIKGVIGDGNILDV